MQRKRGRPMRPKRIMTYEEMLKDLKRAIEREVRIHRRKKKKGQDGETEG